MMPKASAIIFLHLIYGSINALAAPSFRGGHNNNRILVECSTHRKKPDCNSDGACSWNQSLRTCDVSPATPPPVVTLSPSRSPIVSPVTPFPTISPTPGPSKSPQIAGMGHCSDNISMQCRSTDECACAEIGGAVVPPFGDDRKLIECNPNAAKRNECNNIGSGCDWIDKQCVPTATITSSPTVLPTNSPSKSPSSQPTKSPIECTCFGIETFGPSKSPVTLEPSMSPTDSPSSKPTDAPAQAPTDRPTKSPTPSPVSITPSPTNPPTPEQTYCGCDECTQSVWDTQACNPLDPTECYSCGSRITHKQTWEGGSLSLSEACAFVSEEYPSTCGPMCNSETCGPSDSPTPAVTSAPTTPAPTEEYFCGCPTCTQTVLDTVACNGGECYSCGSRMSYLQSIGQSQEDACTNVSNEFPDNVCGPMCNTQQCNPELLDDADPDLLVWSDEFDTNGSPSSNNWDYDIGNGCEQGICGWGNEELQSYTSDSNNVVINNGILRISAKNNGGYTSTRIVTRGKKFFKYGRMRIRANIANCQALGTWPALWMLPENWEYGGWPSSGEIDIMEAVGYETDKFHGSVHTEAYNHGIGTQKTGSVNESKDEWHIFEIDWQADNIRFAIDGKVYYTFTPPNVADYKQWPFDKEFHIIMNIAVGGTWGGTPDDAAFEGDGQYMEIDWVRVYSS